ncbi:hypothetical protein RRG08_032751, partial [Elysia crispata]
MSSSLGTILIGKREMKETIVPPEYQAFPHGRSNSQVYQRNEGLPVQMVLSLTPGNSGMLEYFEKEEYEAKELRGSVHLA